MARPRELSVWGLFLGLVRSEDLLPSGCRVLVAVSGGADSVCLLDLLRSARRRFRLELVGFHMNHRLRPKASRDEDFVRGLFEEDELVVVRSDVRRYARRHGKGLEESARELRYRHMARAARRLACARIALGHTADDNLETVLLNLCRGSGRRGLAGIPVRRGKYVRPLLDMEHERAVAHLLSRELEWVEDESNRDSSFRRNYVRLKVVPLLKELNPGVVRNARRASRMLAAEEDELDRVAAMALDRVAVVKRGRVLIDTAALQSYNPILTSRMVRQLLSGLEGEAVMRVLDCLCADDPRADRFVDGIRLRRDGRFVELDTTRNRLDG